MTFQLLCTSCGRMECYKSKGESIDKGCGGCEGGINSKPVFVRLCSKCYSPKNLSDEIEKQLGVKK